MKQLISTLILLLNFTFVYTQVHKGFNWNGLDHCSYNINVNTGNVSKVSPQKIKTEIGTIENWSDFKNELPGDFGVNTFYRKDSILITIPGTGQLYSLKLKPLKLTRLDETFFRGYNFNAIQFFRKDTLFSIGGEGFWNKHSLITYYNKKTAEWDLYPSNNENKHATKLQFGGYSKKNDIFFSADLETLDVLEGKEIYFNIYSFKDKKWETKGELSDLLLNYGKNKFKNVWTGNYLILYSDIENKDGYVLILDPFNNEVFQYYITDNHFFLLNSERYYFNDYLFSKSLVSTGKMDKIYFDSLSVSTMILNSKLIGKVYNSGIDNSTYAITCISVIIAFLGIVIYLKRKSISCKLKLSDLELLIVKEFLDISSGKKISSNELNQLFQIENKSYDNQRQIRNRIITNINQQLYSYMDSKDLILRASNIEDKRMMDYYRNSEIKTKDLDKIKGIILVKF